MVTGFTDSLVSASVVSRGLTTTFPLCAVAMELAAQLEDRKAELFLEWVPRDTNTEADRLADGDSTGFDPALQVKASIGQVRWKVLDRLMEAGLAFQRDTELYAQRTGKRQGKQAGSVAKSGRQKLREKEPW